MRARAGWAAERPSRPGRRAHRKGRRETRGASPPIFFMQIRIFTIPLQDDGTEQEIMNRFLRGHKILQVDQHFRDHPAGATWCFCIHYLDPGITGTREKRKGKKVDYKTVLSGPAFALFSQMREIRKEIAKTEGLPAFAVFTDEELAKITALPALTAAQLKTIDGFGDKKIERFGIPMLEKLRQESQNNPS